MIFDPSKETRPEVLAAEEEYFGCKPCFEKGRNRHIFQSGFNAGAASRDAEIAELVAALECVLPWVITQTVACCGLKCREQVCISCEGEEDAEKNAQIACEKYHIAKAALAKMRKGHE